MEHEQPDKQSKRGSARERQQRRRERQQSVGQRATIPRTPSRIPNPRAAREKVKAPGGVEMPQINMRYVQYAALGIGAVLFMGAVIFLVGLFAEDPTSAPANALWIGEEWTYTSHTDDEVREFVAFLREHRIGSVYARVSELNFDGSWTGRPEERNQFNEVQEQVVDFAVQFNRFYPEGNLFGMVGVPADIGGEEGYRLDDDQTQQTVVDFSAQIVNTFGFDGIMLNVEPVWDGDEHFLTLIRRVRQAIGDEHLLAVAIPPDWTPIDAGIPTPSLIAPGTVWDQQYKQRVALIQIDQLVVEAYNSYLTDAGDYSQWIAYQVETYANAVFDLQTDTDVLIGLPTYAGAPPAHEVGVENVISAVNGIRQGLTAAGDAAPVIVGVAIYAGWDTDENEWTLYRERWLNQ